MNIKENSFLGRVEDYTESPLLVKNDVKKIIDAAVDNNEEDRFEELAFTSKNISGMFRVLKNASGVPEAGSLEKIKSDLDENIEKAIGQIREIIFLSDRDTKEYFEKNYFNPSSQNFNALFRLFSDLESVKKYLNRIKRKS